MLAAPSPLELLADVAQNLPARAAALTRMAVNVTFRAAVGAYQSRVSAGTTYLALNGASIFCPPLPRPLPSAVMRGCVSTPVIPQAEPPSLPQSRQADHLPALTQLSPLPLSLRFSPTPPSHPSGWALDPSTDIFSLYATMRKEAASAAALERARVPAAAAAALLELREPEAAPRLDLR